MRGARICFWTIRISWPKERRMGEKNVEGKLRMRKNGQPHINNTLPPGFKISASQ
jgi:hypothetical protein